MTARPTRLLLTAALAAGLAFGLAACGKKGHTKPPEGEESEYAYPHAYPAPATVVPNAKDDSGTSGSDDPFWLFNGENRTKTKTY